MKNINDLKYTQNHSFRISIKTIIILFIVFFIYNTSFSQISTRVASTPYVGFGYTFDVFTNSDASDTYPAVSKNFELFKEINLVGGIKLNRSLAIELSPSFAFSTYSANKGFNFTETDGIQRFYLPQTVSFTAIPINARVKFFPFTVNPLGLLTNVYILGGGGPTYMKEVFDNYVFANESQTSYLGAMTTTNSFWKPNYIIGVGYGSAAKVGYNFELTYRMIPLDGLKDKPQTTSIAKDFNSVSLSAIIIFSF